MKILVNEMPTQVEDCPWSYPTENPWNDRTIWFCQWALSNGETCPMTNGGECLYFIAISQKSNLDYIVDAFNDVPEVYQL